MNDSDISIDDLNQSDSKHREEVKNEFNGLNHRLLSYMDRVRQNEATVAELSNAKQALEKQIEILKKTHSEQTALLRSELDDRVRKTVVAEEKLSQAQQELTKHEQAVANRDRILETQRLHNEQLEQALVKEKQMVENAMRRSAELKEALMKTHEEREHLKDECTRLKVEAAKLQEQVKVASLEITMHENKMSAVEKELLYSTQDVSAKLMEQRKRLEIMGTQKLEEVRNKHNQELERCRREFEKKLQDTLQTYVCAGKYAALQTESESYRKRAEQAELKLTERDNLIRDLRDEMEKLEKAHQQKMIAERGRRERINKRLLAQSRDLEEIRNELETYRKLLEGFDLDVDGQTFCRTPVGAKRLRTSFESSPLLLPSSVMRRAAENHGTPNGKSNESTPVSLEARKALLKRALTPRKRTSSDGDEKIPTSSSERDCLVM
ncbi:uveal autoantigen with coiled-coil domains and ankyrin repeats [Galendromus occidentalis]|uniref:Uveal autoantigen with coiled-coil domains and ankyrin repeats n=1 Tax=Galendromus occidentalis TaxID=34638 RepID=A0AAJ7PAR2_9ACAR|nr:uveal autoantigen with coiled-coil domains and ankyrin repeats [Galendromus occidentalis]